MKTKLKKGDAVDVPSWATFGGVVLKVKGETVWVKVYHPEEGHITRRFHLESICPVIHQIKETVDH